MRVPSAVVDCWQSVLLGGNREVCRPRRRIDLTIRAAAALGIV